MAVNGVRLWCEPHRLAAFARRGRAGILGKIVT